MRVEIDSHSGFCFGVVRAISRAEEALQEQGEVFSLGDIVHNRVEVQRLERLGRRRDLVGVRIRGERDLKALDRLCAAAAAAVLLAAAGHQAERHDQRQHHCHYFFHVHTLQINSFSRPRA